MSDSAENETQDAEFAHVLMLDMVGYSRQTQEEQDRAIRLLTRLVRETKEFRRLEKSGDILALPTGDGLALVVARYPLAPLQCAVEIVRALAAQPGLSVRLGLHCGPVTRHDDINGAPNVTGGGINTAQRVMDSGDAGHILLSGSYADIARQFAQWRDALHDLGDCVVKHNETLRLFSLRRDDWGNPEIPAKLRQAAKPPEAAPAEVNAAEIQNPKSKIQNLNTVALLYKRNAPHSARLLDLLEAALKDAGYRVFIDRHLQVGVEWARELAREISAAYAVVPLLSAESIWSEMLEDEIVKAREASSRNGGIPRLLPVRVGYEGPLPDTIQAALGHLQYILWRGSQDDDVLTRGLLDSLGSEPKKAVALEPVGGAMPLDSKFYIERREDIEFAGAMQRRDSIVLVKGARQMGKTSLVTRGLQQARESGAKCFRVDFQKLTSADLSDEPTFFRSLAEMIADQLDCDTLPDERWNSSRSGAYNFERYLRREVLAPSLVPLVWALDEVDKLFACAFGGDVFALFRSWHNDRAYEPDGPWAKLTLVIAYATEAHLFITDVNQSPFNVGTRLTLADFEWSEVAELNRRYGSPLQSEAEIERLHALTGGQPYLTRRALDHLAQRENWQERNMYGQGISRVRHDFRHIALQGASLEEIEAEADRDEGIFGDHLRRLLVSLSQDGETLEITRRFLKGESLPDPAVFYRLRSGGLIAGDSILNARLRCQLYGRYLTRRLA